VESLMHGAYAMTSHRGYHDALLVTPGFVTVAEG